MSRPQASAWAARRQGACDDEGYFAVLAIRSDVANKNDLTTSRHGKAPVERGRWRPEAKPSFVRDNQVGQTSVTVSIQFLVMMLLQIAF